MAKAKSHTAKAKTTMAHPLYLTTDERKLFDALPAKLKEGWEVKEERRTFHDTKDLRTIRQKVAHFEHPKLRSLHEQACTMKTPEKLQPLLRSLVLEEFEDADICELFFLLGPEVLSVFILSSLRDPKNTSEVEHISSVTILRSALLNAFVPA